MHSHPPAWDFVGKQTYAAVHIRRCAQPDPGILHARNPAVQRGEHSAGQEAPYELRTLCQLKLSFFSADPAVVLSI